MGKTSTLIPFSFDDYEALYFVRRHHPVNRLNWQVPDIEAQGTIEAVVRYAVDEDNQLKSVDFLVLEITEKSEEYEDTETNVFIIPDLDSKKLNWSVEDDDGESLIAFDEHPDKKMLLESLVKILPKIATESARFKKHYEKALASTEIKKIKDLVCDYKENKKIETWVQIIYQGVLRSVCSELQTWKKLTAKDNTVYNTPWLADESREAHLKLSFFMPPLENETHRIDYTVDIVPDLNRFLMLKEEYGYYSHVRTVLSGPELEFFLTVLEATRINIDSQNVLKNKFINQPPVSPAAYLELCQVISDHDYSSEPIDKALEMVQSSYGRIYIRWNISQIPADWFQFGQRQVFEVFLFYNAKYEFFVQAPTSNLEVFDLVSKIVLKICAFFNINPLLKANEKRPTITLLGYLQENAKALDQLFNLLNPMPFKKLSESASLGEYADPDQPLGLAVPDMIQLSGLFWNHDGFIKLPTLNWDRDSDLDFEIFRMNFKNILSKWAISFTETQVKNIFTKKSITRSGFENAVQLAAKEFKLSVLDVSDSEVQKIYFVPTKLKAAISKLIKTARAPVTWLK